MLVPHAWQRPRSSAQETTGTLSRLRIGAPQDGHRERGWRTDSPFGTRPATTVMKLPAASPRGSAISTRIGTSSMAIPTSSARPDRPTSRVDDFLDVGEFARPSQHLSEVDDALREAGDLISRAPGDEDR